MNRARIFQNGRSQAVRLPKEFRFEGDKVFVHKLGNAVVLLPVNSAVVWEQSNRHSPLHLTGPDNHAPAAAAFACERAGGAIWRLAG